MSTHVEWDPGLSLQRAKAEFEARVERLFGVIAFHQALSRWTPAKTPLGVLSANPGSDRWRGAMNTAEEWVINRDARLGTHRFERLVGGANLSDDVVAAYASLLADRLGDDEDRRDRLEFLVQRMVTISTGDAIRMLPAAEAEVAIEGAIGGRVTAPVSRETALRFFHEISDRALRLESVDEAFSSGLLSELRGFKATLGAGFLDVKILYASIATTVVLLDRLSALADAEEIPHEAVMSRYWLANVKLRAVFRRLRRAQKHDKLGKVDWNKFKRVRKRKAVATESRLPRPTLRMTLGLAVIALCANLVIQALPFSRNELLPLDAPSLSPILASASISSGADAPTVIAQTNDAWRALAEGDRKRVANELRAQLQQQGIAHALVKSGTGIAIRIEGGVVRFVEGT